MRHINRAVGWCQHCGGKSYKLLIGVTAKESFTEGFGSGCVRNFASGIAKFFFDQSDRI